MVYPNKGDKKKRLMLDIIEKNKSKKGGAGQKKKSIKKGGGELRKEFPPSVAPVGRTSKTKFKPN